MEPLTLSPKTKWAHWESRKDLLASNLHSFWNICLPDVLILLDHVLLWNKNWFKLIFNLFFLRFIGFTVFANIFWPQLVDVIKTTKYVINTLP